MYRWNWINHPRKHKSKVNLFRDTSIIDLPLSYHDYYIDSQDRARSPEARYYNHLEVTIHTLHTLLASSPACRDRILIGRFLGFRTRRALRHLFYRDWPGHVPDDSRLTFFLGDGSWCFVRSNAPRPPHHTTDKTIWALIVHTSLDTKATRFMRWYISLLMYFFPAPEFVMNWAWR